MSPLLFNPLFMIKVLVHSPSPSDGTSFYRAYGPLNALQKEYPDKVQITDCSMEVSWNSIRQFDIVFMQRPASKWQVDFIKMAKTYGVAVWVDWDDNYLEIPDSNNRKEYYTPFNIDLIRWIAKNADYITVSTEHLLGLFKQFNENISVVRNGTDFEIFNPNRWRNYKRDNLIMWRGSDTHNADFETYKQEIIELMDETPDYVWGFFGYWPEWAIDHLPSHRIKLFTNDGVIEYIKTLMALNPKLVYVPLEDIPFNHSKSNIAWQEATLAGATVVCPDWEEWNLLPAFKYNGKHDFKEKFHQALNRESGFNIFAEDHLKGLYDVKVLNRKRLKIIESLIQFREEYKVPPVELPEPFTNEQFFNYNRESGWTQENPAWVKGQEEMAKYCKEMLGAQSVFDLGCGTGGLIEACMSQDIVVMGIDSNPLNKEFFDKRNPENEHRFICDMAQNVVPGNEFDVVVCIEVLEHIPDEVNEKILAIWRDKCKFFIFSSTPFTSTPEFDRQWGHINVKPTPHWIKFFEKNGFKMVQKLDFPTKWSLLFVSCPKV